MDHIDVLFPRYDQAGRELVRAAYLIAEEALKDHTRSNGQPFIGHPLAVARIACDEIGLSAELRQCSCMKPQDSSRTRT